MAFYDFPAKHWQNICTSNPIESVFGHHPASDKAIKMLPDTRWHVAHDVYTQRALRSGHVCKEKMETLI